MKNKPNGILVRLAPAAPEPNSLHFFPITEEGEVFPHSLWVGDCEITKEKINDSYIMYVRGRFELDDGTVYNEFSEWSKMSDEIIAKEMGYTFVTEESFGGFQLLNEEPDEEPKTGKTIHELMLEKPDGSSFKEAVKSLHGVLMASEPAGPEFE